MAKLSEIKTAVVEALTAFLLPVKLVNLSISESSDHEGDPIFRIKAVYDDSDGPLSGDKVFRASGIVHRAIEALDSSRFPIMTFVAKDEADEEAA